MTEYFNTDSVILGNPETNLHDVIIQGLDQSLEYSGQMVNYPVEPFQTSQSAWDGVPAVYVPSGKHIPTAAFNEDPKAALAAYGGSIVGNFENSKVHIAGKPRLQSQARITDDSVEQKILDGSIRLSSAFNAGGTNSIEGPVIPSYVLLFDSDAANPRDKTSMFLNSEPSEEPNMEDAVKIANLEHDLSDEKATTERLNTEMDGSKAQVVELTGTIERLNSEGETKDAKITALETQLTEFVNSAADAKWESMKSTTIPKGLVASEEDEKALRELYNSDAGAFVDKILSVARPDETKKEGKEFNNTEGDDAPVGVGNWNARTQKFE